MNKKTIIIIISVIAALAIVIGGTIAILSSKFNDTDKGGKDDITSSSVAGDSDTSDNSNTASDGASTSEGDATDADISVPKATKDITTFIAANVTTKIGSKVKVPVYVSNNKGFMGLMAKFQYDSAALKYTGYKKGDVLTDYDINATDGNVGFISVENGDVKKDGVIIYLEFDVIAKVPTTTPVKVVIGEGDVGNQSEKLVKTDTIDGSVIIK